MPLWTELFFTIVVFLLFALIVMLPGHEFLVLFVEIGEIGNNDRYRHCNSKNSDHSTHTANEFADTRHWHLVAIPHGRHGYDAIPEGVWNTCERTAIGSVVAAVDIAIDIFCVEDSS